MEEIVEDLKIFKFLGFTYEVQPTRTLAKRAREIRFLPTRLVCRRILKTAG